MAHPHVDRVAAGLPRGQRRKLQGGAKGMQKTEPADSHWHILASGFPEDLPGLSKHFRAAALGLPAATEKSP